MDKGFVPRGQSPEELELEKLSEKKNNIDNRQKVEPVSPAELKQQAQDTAGTKVYENIVEIMERELLREEKRPALEKRQFIDGKTADQLIEDFRNDKEKRQEIIDRINKNVKLATEDDENPDKREQIAKEEIKRIAGIDVAL